MVERLMMNSAFRLGSPRMIRIVLQRSALAMAAVLALSACSAVKLGYNNSASIAHTYLVNKIDFEPQQEALLKTSLTSLVAWHRQHELPILADALKNAREVLAPSDGAMAPVSVEQLREVNQVLRDSLRRTAEQVAPAMARSLLGLYPNQVQDIQRQLDKSNDDYRKDRLATDPEQQWIDNAKRTVSRFERWLGKLSPNQRERIEQWAQGNAQQAQANYERRLARQQEFMNLVSLAANRQIDHSTLSLELAKLLNRWQTPATALEMKQAKARQEKALSMTADVLNLASPKQRANAAKEAQKWANDFTILVEQT